MLTSDGEGPVNSNGDLPLNTTLTVDARPVGQSSGHPRKAMFPEEDSVTRYHDLRQHLKLPKPNTADGSPPGHYGLVRLAYGVWSRPRTPAVDVCCDYRTIDGAIHRSSRLCSSCSRLALSAKWPIATSVTFVCVQKRRGCGMSPLIVK